MHVLVLTRNPEEGRFRPVESIRDALADAHATIVATGDAGAAWIEPDPDRCEIDDYLAAVNLNGFLAARLGDDRTPWRRLDMATLTAALGEPPRTAHDIDELLAQPGLLDALLEEGAGAAAPPGAQAPSGRQAA